MQSILNFGSRGKLAIAICFGVVAVLDASGQDVVAKFHPGGTVRIESDSRSKVDTLLRVAITKTFKGSLTVSVVEGGEFVNDQPETKYIIKQPTDTIRVRFSLRRDAKDDRRVKFHLDAFNEKEIKLKLGADSVCTILLKPVGKDTLLRSSEIFESWFFAGTNFDMFNGVKAQEFFFRWNNVLRVTNKVFVQTAIYKNRYFTADSSTANTYQKIERLAPRLDSVYRVAKGTYRKQSNQTFDPVGWQMDVLYKIKDEGKGSNNAHGVSTTFFATLGFDLNTITTTVENKYSDFDTTRYVTKQPDTIITGRSSTVLLPGSFSYKTKSSNINVGFMYIFDNSVINFKAHFTAGLTQYNRASVIVGPTRSNPNAAITTVYRDFSDLYLQLRAFGTYKPLGISIGFEAFYRSGDFLGVNTTLSKVFDLENFTKILSPINSLNLK